MRCYGLAFLCGVVFSSSHLGASEPRRPNVLWICADDHAPYVCGAYGNKAVRTPNMDRLASRGMRFDRAYCNSPVCTASRQSFLTGRYPRTIGVTQLRTPLPEAELTLAEMLKQAGFATAAFGKMHFNSNLLHGFDRRLDAPQFQEALRQRGKKAVPPDVEVQPPWWRPFRDPARIWLNSVALPFGAVDADMASTWMAEQAAGYLEEKRDLPFFLMVSFQEPHSPFHFPVEYRGRHRLEAFPVPRVGPEDDRQIPAIFRGLTDQEKQGIIAAYHTSVEFLDKNVGLVLDALKRSGKEENTLILYTGDHGYMLGQHGRFEKHCCYEPAVRSPLFIVPQGSGSAGRSTEALVGFIDLVPTILSLAGVPIPSGVQGKSLVPLLRGQTARHREHVVVEYAENEEAMIRTERWKFIYCTGKRERQDGYATGRPLPGRTIQLFDLDHDPEEFTNLADRPEHAPLVTGFTTLLVDHLRKTARQPEMIPSSNDPHAVLEFCLQPRDVK